MKKLKDYYWGQNEYRIKTHILYPEKTYEELFATPLINGFVTILMGTYLLKEMGIL